jgi:hypothetical protein
MKESVVLFADFAMKVVREIWPKGKGGNTVIGIAKGQEGQWLMSCTGHSFSKKETRFAFYCNFCHDPAFHLISTEISFKIYRNFLQI